MWVGKKTDEIIDGSTLVDIRGRIPCVKESVEELCREDNGERFELEVTEFNSAVDVEIDDVNGIAAEIGDVNSEVP